MYFLLIFKNVTFMFSSPFFMLTTFTNMPLIAI
nr:MAG TPA: hypothetical protein [Caudoviricetes sp.]